MVGQLDCASNCPEQAPCGRPTLFTITSECYIFVGTGDWPSPLNIQATGAVHPVFRHWDPRGTGDYIRNLKFVFTGDANAQPRLEFWNATGTVVNVTSNNLAISNSAFILDDLEPFHLVFVGTYPRLDIQYTSLRKNLAISNDAITIVDMGTQQMDIVISSSTFDMPAIRIFGGNTRGVTIIGSSLNAYSLAGDISESIDISGSHLSGFLGSLCMLPALWFSSSGSTFAGLSRTQPFSLFAAPALVNTFTTSNCNFTWVQFSSLPIPTSNVVAIGNEFHDCRFRFELSSPLGVPPIHIQDNTFVRYSSSYPALELTSPDFNSMFISGNQFENRYSQLSDDTCSVSLVNLIVSSASNLVTDGLCVGNTQFDGSLDASFVDSVPTSMGYINTTGNIKLSSFTSEVNLTFSKNHLSYSITNASQGIDAFVDEMPHSVYLSWDDTNYRLSVGDSWPLFPKADPRAVLPTILSTNGSFTFSLSSSCPGTLVTCMVNFTVLSVSFCPTPQPSPEFICQHGTWSSNTSITQDTLNIPSNSGTIVVNGNLTITQTVIFQGLGSLINVTGCIFVDGDVVVELTDHDIEEIRKGSKTFILMSSVDGNDCESSNDLSLIPINVKTPDKCVKVDAVNSGSKQTLAATFTISQSKCSSSHLVAIIVPSVVGGVIILSALAVIVFLKIRHDKMHR